MKKIIVLRRKMNFKRKIYISILAIGATVFNSYFVWGSESGKKISTMDQPYLFYGERTFMVGFLEPLRDSGWGKPVPKTKEGEIYDFVIKDTLSNSFEMFAATDKIISFEELKKKHLFFTGHVKAYGTHRLIKENPHIDWLRGVSLMHVSVFEIEQMLPVENSESALAISLPDALSEKFEVSVTVRNTLQKELIDSTLLVNISGEGGAFKIIGGDSYYTKAVKDKYGSGESKVYNFQIETRNSRPPEVDDFKISVAFAGYGVEGELVNPEIFPIYSKKSYRYQMKWLEVQED